MVGLAVIGFITVGTLVIVGLVRVCDLFNKGYDIETKRSKESCDVGNI